MRDVCHNICHQFVFSPEYTWSSKVDILCLGSISETTWWPVSVYLYLNYQWLHNNWVNAREPGELTNLRLVPHMCATVLDPVNGPAWIHVMAGRHIPSVPGNHPNSCWLIVNSHRQVSDAQNVQNCHKQVLNNKTVWNCVWIFHNIMFLSMKCWKEISFHFSLPSSHFIVSSPMYELLINYESLFQFFNHI